VSILPATESSETRAVRRISLIARTVVLLNWVTILAILAARGVPKSVALGAFTVFRITAIVAAIWLIAEIAEGFAGRTNFVTVVLDGFLTLPMFTFWFLVAVSTF